MGNGEQRKYVAGSRNVADASKKCQKCLAVGHYTFECKNERAYVQRPSRTKMVRLRPALPCPRPAGVAPSHPRVRQLETPRLRPEPMLETVDQAASKE